MGLFKRKMSNAAVGPLPNPTRPLIQPGPTNIHNHGVNWPAVVIVVFGCIILLGPAGWFALVYLFDRLGSLTPEAHAAGLLIFVPLAFSFLWFVSWIVGPHLDRHYAHLDFTEEQKTAREQARLLAAQTTLDPGRYNEADYDFGRVVISVMSNAYNWLEKEEYTAFPGRWRPWSLSSSKKTADEIGVKISQDKANEVSKWLYERGVITDPVNGQIAKKFPNLTNVKALLDSEFGPGVIRQVSPTIRQNRGFKFTD